MRPDLLRRSRASATEVVAMDIFANLALCALLMVGNVGLRDMPLAAGGAVLTETAAIEVAVTVDGIFLDGKGPLTVADLEAELGRLTAEDTIRVTVSPAIGIAREHEVLGVVRAYGAGSVRLVLMGSPRD